MVKSSRHSSFVPPSAPSVHLWSLSRPSTPEASSQTGVSSGTLSSRLSLKSYLPDPDHLPSSSPRQDSPPHSASAWAVPGAHTSTHLLSTGHSLFSSTSSHCIFIPQELPVQKHSTWLQLRLPLRLQPPSQRSSVIDLRTANQPEHPHPPAPAAAAAPALSIQRRRRPSAMQRLCCCSIRLTLRQVSTCLLRTMVLLHFTCTTLSLFLKAPPPLIPEHQ